MLSKDSLEKVERRYGFRISSCHPIPSIYRTEAAYRIQTSEGQSLILKPLRYPSERRRVLATAWRTIAENRDCDFMPSPVKTLDHHRFTRLDRTYHYVMPWIETTGSWHEETYAHLGRTLAKLHTWPASKATLPKANPTVPRWRKQDLEFRAQYNKKQSIAHRTLARWLDMHGPTCIALSDEAWSLLADRTLNKLLVRQEASKHWIHGDVTVPNVIPRSDGVTLIDWERIKTGSPLVELALTLSNTTNWNLNYMRQLLSGYEQIQPLSTEERHILRALFRLPKEVWFSTQTSNPSPLFRVVKDTWNQRLQAIHWLDRYTEEAK